MPKTPLSDEFKELEHQLIQTMLAGHQYYRPDLTYPESHSDMQGCARGVLLMFDVQRRPLALQWKDILEEEPTCVICNKPGFLLIGGTHFCGNSHAREFANNVLRTCPET